LNYNESMIEQFAVLAVGAPISLNATALVLPSSSTGVQLGQMQKVILDVNQGVGAGTFTLKVECSNATAGTYVDVTYNTANTSFPLFPANPTTLGAAGTMLRFEFTEEALGAAIVGAIALGNTTAGRWFRFTITESATATLMSATLYGVAANYPSADVVINPFPSTANTPAVTRANSYLNGVAVSTLTPVLLPY
jgi:hypothetical protein